ncbi:hypothetical protein ABZ864_31740 [Streptomyces sp. NPDC047082]|uniref:hypothetical protein n=1 Tax=Streptomyces sp. NPDC047082 TaxID=3155259 RepID=UPI003407BECB
MHPAFQTKALPSCTPELRPSRNPFDPPNTFPTYPDPFDALRDGQAPWQNTYWYHAQHDPPGDRPGHQHSG